MSSIALLANIFLLCSFGGIETTLKTDQLVQGVTIETYSAITPDTPFYPTTRALWKYSQNALYYLIWHAKNSGITTGSTKILSYDDLDTDDPTTEKTYAPTATYTQLNDAIVYEIGNVIYFAFAEFKNAAGEFDAKLHLISYTHATTTWVENTYDIANKYFRVVDIMIIGAQVYVVGAIMDEAATDHWHIEIRKWDNSATATDTIEIDEIIPGGTRAYLFGGFVSTDYHFLLKSGATNYWRKWTSAAYAAVETLPAGTEIGDFIYQDSNYYIIDSLNGSFYKRVSATSWLVSSITEGGAPIWTGTNREIDYVVGKNHVFSINSHGSIVDIAQTTNSKYGICGFGLYTIFGEYSALDSLMAYKLTPTTLRCDAGHPFKHGYGIVPSGTLKTNSTIYNNQYLKEYNATDVLIGQGWVREYNALTGDARIESPLQQDLMKDITVAAGTDWDDAIEAAIDLCKFLWYSGSIDNVAGVTPEAFKGKLIDFLIWADQVNVKRHYIEPDFEIWWDDGDVDTTIDIAVGDGVYNCQKVPVNVQYSRLEAQGALKADGTYVTAAYQASANFPALVLSFPQYKTDAALATFLGLIGPKFDQIVNRYSLSVVGKAFIQVGMQITLVSTHFKPIIASAQYYVIANNCDPVSGHQHLIVEDVFYYISNNIGITLGSLYQQIQSGIQLLNLNIPLYPILPWVPVGGFAESAGSGFGPLYWIAHDDTDAYMYGAFHVTSAGSYKIAVWLTSEQAATYGFSYYASATVSGGAASNVLPVQATSGALTTAAVLFTSNAFTVSANSYVYVYFKKTDHPAVIAGSMYFLGGILQLQ